MGNEKMKIELIQGGGEHLLGFNYLWLKDVNGFNPTVHCAQCLVGEYSKLAHKKFPVGKEVELPDLEEGHTYYLCGVSSPYKWERNLHLAFIKGDWEVTLPLYTGASFKLHGVEAVPFNDRVAKRDYPTKGKEFLTCRNFQFGAALFPKK